MQTKTPKRQLADDSEDVSNSCIDSDSSMSVKAAPRALIWRNDTSSANSGRKVSRLHKVSTIHSVRKSKRLFEKRDNAKAEAKSSTESETVVSPAALPAEQTAPLSAEHSSEQPTSAAKPCRKQRPTNTAETMRRRGEKFYEYNQDEPRPRFEVECKSTPNLSSSGAEFEGIRLATRIHELYHARVPEEEFMKLPAQKGTLRISNADCAVQPMYLHDPEKDDRDLYRDYMVLEPPRNSSKWRPRPYSLAEIVYECDTEDEEQRSYQRDAQDHYYENHAHHTTSS